MIPNKLVRRLKPQSGWRMGGRSGEICHWAKLGRGRIKINVYILKIRYSHLLRGKIIFIKVRNQRKKRGRTMGLMKRWLSLFFLGNKSWIADFWSFSNQEPHPLLWTRNQKCWREISKRKNDWRSYDGERNNISMKRKECIENEVFCWMWELWRNWVAKTIFYLMT